ncbi:MAG: hypothetical protein F6K54_01520 [Okeania sp. SIO3B5]|uniref:hypothetical protein n=1 Tax=Okeania sp. SIO3B5 TaxID=2607811 RepID=UPI001400833D|nr:hypothetical protein [Okeania sp. SIO3B5]NEO51881.1 hypothetical protein [Okeania sp. SIO3B5]
MKLEEIEFEYSFRVKWASDRLKIRLRATTVEKKLAGIDIVKFRVCLYLPGSWIPLCDDFVFGIYPDLWLCSFLCRAYPFLKSLLPNNWYYHLPLEGEDWIPF